MKPQPYGPYRFIPINRRPKQSLPGGARIAVWVIPNIESFALDERISSPHIPDVRNFALRDYGNRVGVYRLADTLTKFGIRGTVALNSEVADRFPEVIEHTKALGWEFMGHNQSNTRPLSAIPSDQERSVIFGTLDRIEKAIGKRPRGWLGSGLIETWNTLDYLVEGGVDYVCDWVNDDQPYLMDVGGKRLVSIPYSIEINDLPVILTGGHTAFEFRDMIRAQFDVLYREGAESARVMAICLHPFVIGQPHRIGALEEALAYICKHEGVWLATGSEIVDNFLADNPF